MEFELLGLSGYKVNGVIARNDGDICIYFIVKELIEKIKTDTFVDIGADQGAWSFMVKYLNPSSKIYAFEPNPGSFKELEKTRIEGIEYFQVALSDTIGFLALNTDGANSNSRTINETSLLVKKDILGNYIQIDTYIDIIKIDTEGHDLHILRSLKEMVCAKKIGTIITEWSIYWYGENPEECLENSKAVLTFYNTHFKYIYALSRCGMPFVVRLQEIDFDTFLEEHLYKKLQTDICFTNEEILTIPVCEYKENTYYA